MNILSICCYINMTRTRVDSRSVDGIANKDAIYEI